MSEASASGAPAPTPIASGESPKSAQAEKPAAPDYRTSKHRVRIEGRDVEVSYDDLVRGYGTNAAATQRFQAAKKAADEAAKIIAKADSPEEAVQFLVERHGPEKARKLFEDYLLAQMDYDQLPESEKRARQLEKERDALKGELEREKAAEKAKEAQATAEKAWKDLDNDIGEALEKLGRKPTPYLVARIADEMAARLSARGEKIPASKAAEHAIKGIKSDIAEYLTGMSVDEAYQVLPKPFLDAIRQHEVEKVLSSRQTQRAKPALRHEAKPVAKEKVGTDEWFKRRFQKVAR